MFKLKTLAGVLSILAASLVLPALAVGASAQQPAQLQAMTPDGWGASNSRAQSNLRGRYSGITSVSCVGVYMAGYGSESARRTGGSTIWDKNQCSGRVRSGSRFTAVHDAKSGSRWTIYRLKGASLKELRTGLLRRRRLLRRPTATRTTAGRASRTCPMTSTAPTSTALFTSSVATRTALMAMETGSVVSNSFLASATLHIT